MKRVKKVEKINIKGDELLKFFSKEKILRNDWFPKKCSDEFPNLTSAYNRASLEGDEIVLVRTGSHSDLFR